MSEYTSSLQGRSIKPLPPKIKIFFPFKASFIFFFAIYLYIKVLISYLKIIKNENFYNRSNYINLHDNDISESVSAPNIISVDSETTGLSLVETDYVYFKLLSQKMSVTL